MNGSRWARRAKVGDAVGRRFGAGNLEVGMNRDFTDGCITVVEGRGHSATYRTYFSQGLTFF